MDYILFAIALLLLLSAGAGITVLILRGGYSPAAAEFFSLSFLLGTAFISLAQFILGLVINGLLLKAAVSILCGLLGVFALLRLRTGTTKLVAHKTHRDWLRITILVVQVLIVFWVSLRLSFAYDGIFLWEAKARLIFSSGGRMPVEYFRADPAYLPHPNYPLLLPYTENWFYQFLGRPHQGWLKLVLPLFYVSAIGLFLRKRCYLPAILMFFVPVMMIRAMSGEADFPLAVFYLACGVYLLDYLATRNVALLGLAAVFAAILPWVKREGAILVVVVLVTGALSLLRERKWRETLVLCAPGVAWLVTWRLFLLVTGAQSHPEYFPVSLTTISTNIHRVPVIALETSKDLLKWQKWSLLWLIPLKAFRSLRIHWQWLVMIVAPMVLYAGIYIFSVWDPFTGHIESSYSRLLTHVALLALAGAGDRTNEGSERSEEPRSGEIM